MAKEENIKLNKYILALCKKVGQEFIDENNPVLEEINDCIGEYKDGRGYDFNGWYIPNYPTFVGMYVANFAIGSNDKGERLSSFEKACFIAGLIEGSDFGALLCRVGR